MAAGFRMQRTGMVLLLVPDIANPFWSGIARAVQDRLEASGYAVVVANSDWSEERERKSRYRTRSGSVQQGAFSGGRLPWNHRVFLSALNPVACVFSLIEWTCQLLP
jgi:LacI family repressor for deo operon, udp, cdd, tsx, nupC, and nupG